MFLSHKEAGSKIFQLDKEINTTIFEATNGIISYDEFKKRFSLWQNIARDIQPNKMVLWSLRFGKL
jgi:hypothetical protein